MVVENGLECNNTQSHVNTKIKRKLKIVNDPDTKIEIIADDDQRAKHHLESQNVAELNTDYCDNNLFYRSKIKRCITIPFHKISRSPHIKDVLTLEVSKMLEGKCSIEGYVCPGSIQITQHSCGRLHGGNVIFDVDISCLMCLPNEHTKISCVAKTITQAGIRAVAVGLKPGAVSPIEVFLSRDMNLQMNPNGCSKAIVECFGRVREGDTIVVEIIGRRFVLNDTHITIIALLDAIESSKFEIRKHGGNQENESVSREIAKKGKKKGVTVVSEMKSVMPISGGDDGGHTKDAPITGKRTYNRKIKSSL